MSQPIEILFEELIEREELLRCAFATQSAR
jgi:hypothetical protein